MKLNDQGVKDIFDQSFPVPSREQAEVTCQRVLDRLNSGVEFLSEVPVERPNPTAARRSLTPLRAVAALVGMALVSVPFLRTVVFPENVYAIVETVDGSLSRVIDGKAQAVTVGERIDAGTVVRTNAGKGAVLALSDGARIEMGGKSELSLEHADDGTRIRLNVGSVFVKPASQRAGNLYLQNGETTVPVIGALFQSAAPAVQAVAELSPTFEVASIKPSAPIAVSGGRGGPPSAGGASPSGCMPMSVQLDPGRLSVTRATLYSLIGLAYGNRCPLPEVLSGGPEWARTERYDLTAIIPAGSPAYTRRELAEGKAPKLQAMLLNLLTDRFKLALSREMKDMPVYNLVIVKPGKLKFSQDQTGATTTPMPEALNAVPKMYTSGISMPQYAGVLQGFVGRTVVDKTDAKGLYDILILFDPGTLKPPNAGAEFLNESLASLREAIPPKLEEQLGLRLEPARALVEVLFIDRVERPSEN